MKRLFVFAAILSAAFVQAIQAQTITGPKGEVFTKRVIASNLSDPWEITWGPDNFLWITEAKGYLVSRINPANGTKEVLLNLNSQKNFSRSGKNNDKPWPQGGLMGLALHPQLLTGKPYVYLSYVYNFSGANSPGDGCSENFGGCFFTARIVRYKYDLKAKQLVEPEIVCDTIPGSNDHNGGRLLLAKLGGKEYLFYSIGDLGAGQFNNGGRPNHAQDPNFYEGKILRFNAEPDGDQMGYDKWLPNDNPFNTTKQSAVWSIGHRNPQGLAFGLGKLYSTEHGPYSDDEVNVIERGKNYGHPLVIGYNDGNYNGLAASASDHAELPGEWHTTYPTIKSEQDNAAKIGADYRNPIKTFYATPHDTLVNIVTQAREGNRANWISEAPSSIEVYSSSAIPGWKNSLLVPALKTGKLIRLSLDVNGDAIKGDTLTYFKDKARYRDIALTPDGSRIYLSIDRSSETSGPTEGKSNPNNCSGCIVEFTYKGNQ